MFMEKQKQVKRKTNQETSEVPEEMSALEFIEFLFDDHQGDENVEEN